MTREDNDDSLIQEDADALFTDSPMESGMSGIVNCEQVMPIRRKAMLVLELERHAPLILHPNSVSSPGDDLRPARLQTGRPLLFERNMPRCER